MNLKFPLDEQHPAVTHLSAYLENGDGIYFSSSNFHEHISRSVRITSVSYTHLDVYKRQVLHFGYIL